MTDVFRNSSTKLKKVSKLQKIRATVCKSSQTQPLTISDYFLWSISNQFPNCTLTSTKLFSIQKIRPLHSFQKNTILVLFLFTNQRFVSSYSNALFCCWLQSGWKIRLKFCFPKTHRKLKKYSDWIKSRSNFDAGKILTK